MAKMGRPSDNPRRTKLSIRLSDGDKELLEEYCKREKVTRTEAVSRGIQRSRRQRQMCIRDRDDTENEKENNEKLQSKKEDIKELETMLDLAELDIAQAKSALADFRHRYM